MTDSTSSSTVQLWGQETAKALNNFQVSPERVPLIVIKWIARIKAASAQVNAELGLLDPDRADRISTASRRIAAGEFDDQFPVSIFQTGSGTSTHMNLNEVIASVAGPNVHPNDHVNMCQSSNCVFPSAVHLAAGELVVKSLIPALDVLASSLSSKAGAFEHIPKAGRTHLMDAVPVTLGQEFTGYASQIRLGARRVAATLERLVTVPLGGTATGTGLNVHPDFARRVRNALRLESGLPLRAPESFFEATGARDALVETSGALKVVAVSLMKIANDIRLLSSGPRAGLHELHLPALQAGSSMMPGKVNPVIPEVITQVAAQVIGNDVVVTVAGSQGQLELNAFVPVMARNLLESLSLLASAAESFAQKCIDGLVPDIARCKEHADMTLAAATALTPYLGYETVDELVHEAILSGQSLRQVGRAHSVSEDILTAALDPLKLAVGGLILTQDKAARTVID